MAEANAAIPEMIPVTAVADFMRRFGRHFAGVGNAELADERDKQVHQISARRRQSSDALSRCRRHVDQQIEQ